MQHESVVSNRGPNGWAWCLQSSKQAGINPNALHHALLVHHARCQGEWEISADWDPWTEWAYCLQLAGLPPKEIARARQAYFSRISTAAGTRTKG